GFLWDVDTLSSMKLSLPQPHTKVTILEGKSLQDRLRALDLTPALRASIVSGFVEVTGAASFLKHPTQSQLQDRVTLHYRTSTRLDMLSHKLLHDKTCISVTNQKSATHVVVAVLYGEQMFFVFNNTSGNNEVDITLKDVIKKNITSQNTEELLVSLEQANSSFECALYCDAEDFKSPMNVDTAVELFRSLLKRLGPKGQRGVPLKVWLCPLKNLDQTSACVVGSIKEDMLNNAVDVLEHLERNANICEDMMSIYGNLGVSTWYPDLNEALSEFSSLLQQYQSDFQRELASCIKTIREKGEKGDKSLQVLLQRNLQSPFSPRNMHHWLLNKDAKVVALNECRAADITIVKSQEDLKRLVEDSQADRVLCFTLTSLEAEDPFLSALKQHVNLMNTVSTVGTQPPFRLPEFGDIMSCNVKLDLKPELPEIIIIKQTRVTVRLQRPESKSAERYRVEYRAVSCRGKSCLSIKWSVIDFSSTEDSCVIVKLTPETQYQLRYAVMDSTSMSDYSRITEFQTLPRVRPGQPTVLKYCEDSLTVSWTSAEADGDSPVLRYMVEYKEAGLEGWQSILTEGPKCEYTIILPYSTCYRVRVAAIYAEQDASKPTEETDIPLNTWYIDIRNRNASHFLEVLKLQTVKKSVELRGWSDEESEVSSFLQCLPYISQLKIAFWCDTQLFLNLLIKAVECKLHTGQTGLELLASVCTYSSFPYGIKYSSEHSTFLLDLYTHVKNYETQTGRSVLPALQPVYQSAPAVWSVDLSERKSSLLLEVLKLQTVKKPVELRGWSDEESEVKSFLQCLPYISKLRFSYCLESDSKMCTLKFLLGLITAAAEWDKDKDGGFTKLLASVWSYKTFPFEKNAEKDGEYDKAAQSEFLLDLYSHVKNYETQSGRRVLPALKPVYQSAPAVWIINLSERKSSLFLEVLKLQTVKKPVELRGWSDEESEVRSFLQCLPYISQLRLSFGSNIRKNIQIFLDLFSKAAECETQTGEKTLELLTSVCSYCYFPYGETHRSEQCEFLLDLYSHVKNYETQTGRSVLPALQPVYQSAPAVWIINLSERKSSLFLEVLKIQTMKKPVELRGWSDKESEVRSFLQCLPYISQLSFDYSMQTRRTVFQFLVSLSVTAAESNSATGESFTELLTSVCSYTTFPFCRIYNGSEEFYTFEQGEFLLDLYLHVKNYETQTGRSVLPALQPVYQSAPAVWIIDLSERKSSLFLEVLKLRKGKKPVKLLGWSDEKSELRSFLQCLPYISQLGYDYSKQARISQFLVSLSATAAESDSATGESFTELLTSVCSYTTFPFCRIYEDDYDYISKQSRFLLDLYSYVKNYETQTDRSVLPALQPVYQSAPAVWSVDLSERKSSLLLEVLKLQTVKKPVELRGWPDEESEVSGFLQCLHYISQLRIYNGSEEFYTFEQGDFLLDLYLHVKNYETQTGRSVLPALQPVYQSAPAVWIIDLSERKSSLFLEVLKLRKGKKPVKLLGWSDEKSELRSFLQCLPYISQLGLSSRFVLPIIREIYETGSAHYVSSLLSSIKNCINLNSRELDSVHCAALRFILQHCTAVTLSLLWTSIPEGELGSIVPLLSHVSHLSVDRLLLLRLLQCCSAFEPQQGAEALLLSALQHRLDFSCSSALDLTEHTQTHTLSNEDCRVISMSIQRAPTQTQLILQDCEIEESGLEQLFTILHKVTLHCSKALLLQFLSHVGTELESVRRAVALSQALGEEVDLSQTQLDLQACRSLALVLEHSDGLSELDLSHCRVTDYCLELLLPHLHKVQILE
ncbi:hypothetical protein NFI96_025795, partial [Prochilodus magdalenae]